MNANTAPLALLTLLLCAPAFVAGAAQDADQPVRDTTERSESVASERGEDPIRFRLIGRVPVERAEICAYDAARALLCVTSGGKLVILSVQRPADPVVVRTIDVGARAGLEEPAGAELSHVEVDPLGRGVGAVGVIPAKRATVPGRVAFVSLRTGRVLGSVGVGLGPDALKFTPDGSAVVVANEGEPLVARGGALMDPPGSVSVIDLSGVDGERGFEGVDASDVATVYVGGEALGATRLSGPGGVRVHPVNEASPSLDLEPESLAIAGDMAYLSLQENNAIAAFSIGERRFTSIRPLGVHERVLDPSDRDGVIGARVPVPVLPMPDQIASFVHEGRAYLVTADEGDSRAEREGDDPARALADHARVKELGSSTPELARLKVCLFTESEDGRRVGLGARSLSVWDGATGEYISSTGDGFERLIAERWPEWFNASNDPADAEPDSRSDDRGPEPEGVTVGRIGDVTLAFCTLERPGAVAAIDLSNPSDPRIAAIEMSAADGLFGPEGIVFVSAAESPTGSPLVVCAFESSGEVAVYEVIAEGSSPPPPRPE